MEFTTWYAWLLLPLLEAYFFSNHFFYGLYKRFRRYIITNIPVAVHISVILYIQGSGMITFMTGSNLLWAYFKISNYNSTPIHI